MPAATAIRAPGRWMWTFRAVRVTAAVPAASAIAAQFHDPGLASRLNMLRTGPSPGGAATPRADGSCDRRIRIAAPEVKPRSTGWDMR